MKYNMTKKILFTTENITWGGSELLWYKTVLEMVYSDCTIAICTHEKLKLPNELIQAEKEGKLQIIKHSVNNLSFYKRVINRFLPYSNRLKSSNLREQFILDFKPDLIVMNQGYNYNAVDLMLFALQN